MSDLVEQLARKWCGCGGAVSSRCRCPSIQAAVCEAVRESATVAWTAVQSGYGADGVHGRILAQIGE